MNRFEQFVKFCSFIHTNNKCYFACYSQRNDEPFQLFNVAPTLDVFHHLQEYNDKGYDIYLVIQPSVGFHNNEVNGCTFLFFDWDSGRDDEGHYYPIETVTTKKQEQLAEWDKMIENLEMPELSILVETRNGYAGYLQLSASSEFLFTTPILYTAMMKRIVGKLGTDGAVTNPSRVMRVPGFYWNKVGEGLPKYPTKLIRCDESVIYSHQEMSDYFPETEVSEAYVSDAKHGRSSINYGSRTGSVGNYWIVFRGKEPFEVSAFREGGQLHAGCVYCDDPHGHDIVFYGNGWVYCNRCHMGGQAFTDKNDIFKFKREAAWAKIKDARAKMDMSLLNTEELTVLQDYLNYKQATIDAKEYVERNNEKLIEYGEVL